MFEACKVYIKLLICKSEMGAWWKQNRVRKEEYGAFKVHKRVPMKQTHNKVGRVYTRQNPRHAAK
jgi:hypothetical protein